MKNTDKKAAEVAEKPAPKEPTPPEITPEPVAVVDDEPLILEKIGFGLTREQAIEVIENQRAFDAANAS